MDATAWTWDETLYAGSAVHYGVGRMPYPPAMAGALRAALELDGGGRLLDVGCGPGSLTLLLAPLFEAAVGVDADPGMLAEAQHRAGDARVRWRRLLAEDLPADLGTFRVVTFAQSFHWMDRPTVARNVRAMIEPGGAWVHVDATTHRGVDGDEPLPFPRPPWDRIDELVVAHLGSASRAGQGSRPAGSRDDEEEIMRQAGYRGPTRIEVDPGPVAVRSTDEIVSAVFSLSYAAPHLFAGRLPAFEADLRRLLAATSPDGRFAERRREIDLVIWRPFV
jgi:SAM-dependent methyltransferase